jgi:hypothetical protein
MKRTLSIAVLASVSLFLPTRVDAKDPQLAHMVFFTLKEDTQAKREALVAACQKHLSDHEGTVYFSAGAICEELARDINDRDFDVALHLVFADKAAHDKYQTHPRHLKFVDENKQLWTKVRVFDSYVSAPKKEVGASSGGRLSKLISGIAAYLEASDQKPLRASAD